MESVPTVVEYGISSTYAFLGNDLPLTCLSPYFGDWESLLQNLPESIKNKTLRDDVESLPERIFSEETLKSELEWQRAYLMLSFLGQGYIWMDGEDDIVNKLPSKIAVPWTVVSKHLGLKPVGTYSSTVLFNYGIRDPNLPRDSLSNLYALHTFTGSKDEAHFFLIHVLMEMASAPAIQAAGKIHDFMAQNDIDSITKSLQIIRHSLVKIQDVVHGMYDGCNNKVFYDNIRPFFAAKKNETLYEGVDDDFTDLHGASAAQSTGIFVLSTLLGIEQSEETKQFMTTMLDYMPAPHRDFLTMLKGKPSLREYCQVTSDPTLNAHFDEAVDGLVKFRSQHINLVACYIVNPAKKYEVLGSAGAQHAVNFLKNIRDKTNEAKLTS